MRRYDYRMGFNRTLIGPYTADNTAAFDGSIYISDSTLTIYGGRIMYDRAIPINYGQRS